MIRLTVERNQPLLEKKLISQQDFDTLKTKKEAADAQLQMDEAALDQARLNPGALHDYLAPRRHLLQALH